MWEIWDKTSDINGVSAERFLTNNKHLAGEETIYVKRVNGRAVQVEGKSILAHVYGIDATLDDEAFIAAYEAALAAEAEALAEETEEPVTE